MLQFESNVDRNKTGKVRDLSPEHALPFLCIREVEGETCIVLFTELCTLDKFYKNLVKFVIRDKTGGINSKGFNKLYSFIFANYRILPVIIWMIVLQSTINGTLVFNNFSNSHYN